MRMLRGMMLRRKAGPKTGKHTLCELAQVKGISQEPFCAEIYKENAVIPRPAFCASLRSRNAHGHFTRGILRGNLEGKCRRLIPQHAFCASLHSRNAHGHGILCGHLQGKCRTHRIPTSIEHWALPQEPLSVATLFGEICGFNH